MKYAPHRSVAIAHLDAFLSLKEVRKEIREWLKAPNFLVIHRAAMEQHTDKTGTWFIESEEFQEWVKGQGLVLWCTGMREFYPIECG